MKPTHGAAFTRDKGGLSIVVACILILVSCLVAGFHADAKAMSVNLLAGVACTALGVLVAIWVVDQYVRYVSRLRWSRVESLTHSAIAAHICDAMVEVAIGTSFLRDQRPMDSILEGRDKPNVKAVEGMTDLASMLSAKADSWSNDISDNVVDVYSEIRWDLDQLCEGLLPRVIEYSNPQDLINKLVELDRARRALHNATVVHKKIRIGGIVSSLVEVVDACANVYQSLLRHWKLTT
jgi:hypothetical protein